MATANLKAKISLDNSAFTKGMKAVRGDVAAINGMIGGTASLISGKLLAAMAALGGAGAFGAAFKSAIKFGGDFSEMMARTAAEGKGLAVLGQAMKDAGMSAEDAGPMINRMQKALAGTSLGGKSPLEQMKAVGDMIRGLKTPTEQTTAAMAIFGKSGGQMLALFKDPAAMEAAAKVLGGQADILARSAARFDYVSDALANVSVKFRGFFLGMAEKLLPTLERLADWLNSLDLSGLGARIGTAFQSAVNILTNAFKTGQISELIGTATEAGFLTGLDFLTRSIRGVANVIQEAFGQAMAVLAEPSFWGALREGMIATFSAAVASMIDAFAGPLKALQDGLTYIFENAGPQLRKMFGVALEPLLGPLGMLGLKTLEQPGTTPRTLEQIQRESTFSFGGTTAKDWIGSAEAAWKKAQAEMDRLIGQGILRPDKIREAFDRGFSAESVFGEMASDVQAKLKELADKLNVPVGSLIGAAAGLRGIGGEMPGAQGRRYEAASALERIGAIIGGGAASKSVDFVRSTAINTKSMVTLLTQIQANTAKRGGSVEAAYAA